MRAQFNAIPTPSATDTPWPAVFLPFHNASRQIAAQVLGRETHQHYEQSKTLIYFNSNRPTTIG